MPFQRTASLVLLTAVAAVVVVIGPAPAAQDKDAAAEFSIPPEIKELLIARRDTLKQIENAVEGFYKQGVADLPQLLNATLERLAADLELAESREARLETLEKQVDFARRLETVAERRSKRQLVALTDVLGVRADRLALEIDLAREKRKLKRREF